MIKGKPKVDSLRVSIPLIDCEIIDTNLIDRIQVQTINVDTGEIIKEDRKNGTPTLITNEDGTTLKFWKESQFFYSEGKKIPTLYLTFLVNSKYLTTDYFKGITLETLPKIHSYINSFNVVRFSYETLLKARYNDTDVCVDFISNEKEFKKLKEDIRRLTLYPKLWHEASNENNSGIWTPTKDEPRDKATPTNPFVKFYSKEEDFTYQSTQFAQTYFKPSEYKDLYRIEVTVKNAKHKERLSIGKMKTLQEFLKLDLQLIMQQIVKEYFETETRSRILKSKELTPTDKVIIDLLNLAIFNGSTKDELFLLFNRQDVSRESRRLLKEKFHKYTLEDNFNREKLEANSTTKDVLNFLGVNVKR